MNVAFIPVRGGSKSIPLKNIKEINGRPLVYWTVRAACACEKIDKVYVATDSVKIKNTIADFVNREGGKFEKVSIISRSEESASDTASTEFAMLEFADDYEFDNIVLIQATSPLLQSSDLDRGFAEFEKKGVESVISVVRQKRFNWRYNDKGLVEPINYDVYNRPRRQEFDGYLVENGAFYITRKKDLLKSKNRISGNISAVVMCEDSFVEIDEPSDWFIVEALMKKNGIFPPQDNLADIKMFLTDCDGCLTDSGMYYTENGDEIKKFNARDGVGLSLLRQNGFIVGIVTGEDRELNKRRAAKLKLDIIEGGCTDKVEVIKGLCKKYDIGFENVAYVGDDINDLEVIKLVGFSACPSDAIADVKAIVDYVADSEGGAGVIREVAEYILNQHKRLL